MARIFRKVRFGGLILIGIAWLSISIYMFINSLGAFAEFFIYWLIMSVVAFIAVLTWNVIFFVLENLSH